MKTQDELEALKRSWVSDACWDIEDSEGFEEYRGELLAFSQNKKAEWKEQAKKVHTKLENMVCPIRSIGLEGFAYCRVEQCAWWNEVEQCCSIKTLSSRVRTE